MADTRSAKTTTQAATTGYEVELWRMADALRGSMDAAEDRDEYIAENIFWVPPGTRQAAARPVDRPHQQYPRGR